MASVKKSKKKIIIPIIAVVLVIAIAATSGVIISKDRKKEKVTLTSVTTDAITETVSSTGEIRSGAKKEYKAASIATVKEVFVKRGQEVKKGDLLATFDTDDLDEQVISLQDTYNNAKKSYDSAVKAQKDAKANLKVVNAKIKEAEKNVNSSSVNSVAAPEFTIPSSLPSISIPTSFTLPSTSERESSSNDESTQSTESTESTSREIDITLPSISTSQRESTTNAGGYSPDIQGAVAALADLVVTINGLTDSIEDTNKALQIVLGVIAEEMANGNFDSDKIGEAVGKAVGDAIKESTVEFIDSGLAVTMIETAVKNIDYNELAKQINASTNLDQTTAEVMLVALYAQREVYTMAASGPTVASQKQVMDSSKRALDSVKESQEALQAGWTADFDGIITTCDIQPNTQTTILNTGITLENDESRVVVISLGEYDVHKVKVGMSATVTTAYGEYEGLVTDIAPTATGGSNGSVLDSVGSMAGISGLSSLTDSGAGVECEVLVDKPDENIIIGFNANVDIVTNEVESVPTVPISSLVLEKDGAYVFLYNEEDETATKTKIETGMTSDSSYEVLSGIKVGDRVISAPGTYEEDTIKVKVTE